MLSGNKSAQVAVLSLNLFEGCACIVVDSLSFAHIDASSIGLSHSVAEGNLSIVDFHLCIVLIDLSLISGQRCLVSLAVVSLLESLSVCTNSLAVVGVNKLPYDVGQGGVALGELNPQVSPCRSPSAGGVVAIDAISASYFAVFALIFIG